MSQSQSQLLSRATVPDEEIKKSVLEKIKIKQKEYQKEDTKDENDTVSRRMRSANSKLKHANKSIDMIDESDIRRYGKAQNFHQYNYKLPEVIDFIMHLDVNNSLTQGVRIFKYEIIIKALEQYYGVTIEEMKDLIK